MYICLRLCVCVCVCVWKFCLGILGCLGINNFHGNSTSENSFGRYELCHSMLQKCFFPPVGWWVTRTELSKPQCQNQSVYPTMNNCSVTMCSDIQRTSGRKKTCVLLVCMFVNWLILVKIQPLGWAREIYLILLAFISLYILGQPSRWDVVSCFNLWNAGHQGMQSI